ncbi:AAA family ATPase [Promineifilum sp.]|uniref:AAA family ATPase n=1 Tax=Promineifilum sp. TaxID=2664178 RepID=UPI0035AF2E09
MSNPIETFTPEAFHETAAALRAEIGKAIVGQEDVIRHVLIGILSNGHLLLEGVPGLGKTMLIRSLGRALDLAFSRIQFTPDLMPADITGTEIMEEREDGRRGFRFQRGPVFANLVLADEINRATPKTQSALLEAMQERTVTVANTTYPLPAPFFVLATQNPIEQEGTYPLPEAQLDRFLFKVNVPFPSAGDLTEILNRTTGEAEPSLRPVADGAQLIAMQAVARQIPVPTAVTDYVSRLIVATHPGQSASRLVNEYVRYGASPRGGQAIVLGAKVTALFDGRYNVSFDDIAAVAPAALRHRLLLNFEGQAAAISPDAIITDLLTILPGP